MESALQLAKVSLPNVSNGFVRKKLLDQFDEYFDRPTLWVAAPMGAGKTTLISDYIRSRLPDCLWYRLDRGDDDIASFFHYMGAALVNRSHRDSDPIALLKYENQADVEKFSLNFFETVFSQLKKPGVIVFDNYQDLTINSQLHWVVHAAMEAVPVGIHIIVISRVPPPYHYADLLTDNNISVIDGEQLALSENDISDYYQHRIGKHHLPDELITAINKTAEGNVSNVTSALPCFDLSAASVSSSEDATGQVVGYNERANETFNTLNEEAQNLLLQSALFTRFTADMAERLSNCRNTRMTLELLYKSGMFLTRSADVPWLYEYHPPFREFLLHKAKTSMDDAHFDATLDGSVALLAEAGDIDQMVNLLLDEGRWSDAMLSILENAQQLERQGRTDTIKAWIARLPAHCFEKQPWLLYWNAVCVPKPGDDLPPLTRAFDAFKHANDVKGMVITCCRIIDSLAHSSHNIKDLDAWLQELHDLIQSEPEAIENPQLGYICQSTFSASAWHDAQSGKASSLEQRCRKLWLDSDDVELKSRLEQNFAAYYLSKGDLSKAKSILEQGNQLARHTPFQEIVGKTIKTLFYWSSGDLSASRNHFMQGEEIIRSTGIDVLDSRLIDAGICVALSQGELTEADDLLQRLRDRLEERRNGTEWARYHFLLAWLYILRGDTSSYAAECVHRGIELAENIGAIQEEFIGRYGLLVISLANDDIDDTVRRQLPRLMGLSHLIDNPWFRYAMMMMEAYLSLRHGVTQEGVGKLRRALLLARKTGYRQFYFWHPLPLADLYATALRHQLETKYVRKTIVSSNFQSYAPPPDLESWPWPLKIYALDRFHIVRDGKAISIGRKKSNKPIELLKILIAMGGSNVSDQDLLAALWSDLDGDAAYQAYSTALHRLRQIIGPGFVKHAEGQLTLARENCWIDAWACERLLDNQLNLLRSGDLESARSNLDALLKLYSGPLLSGDSNIHAILSARARLHSRVMHKIDLTGKTLIKVGNYQQALLLFKQGMDLDELDEPLYQGAMNCYLQQGRYAQGMAIYQQCRLTLNRVLNTVPAIETENIRKKLQGD